MRHLFHLLSLVFMLFANVASAQITKVAFNSPPGDYIGQGQQFTCTPEDGFVFDATSNFNGGVTVTLHTPNYSSWWQIDFASIDHQPLMVGTYLDCIRYPMSFDASHNQVQVSGTGRVCNTLTGKFVIKELTWETPIKVATFWATIEQRCEGFMPPLQVEVFYKMNQATPTSTTSWGRLKTIYR